MTIRLLDPPLHEFLPEGDLEQIVSELTADTGMTEDEVYSRIEKLSEVNPMLGFRGCRCAFFLNLRTSLATLLLEYVEPFKYKVLLRQINLCTLLAFAEV